MRKLFKTGIFAAMAIAMAACTPAEEPERGEKFMLSRETEYGNDWIYFSFAEGKEVDVKEENHADDLTWDIAFNRYNVRTNGGKSGKGQGGALDTGMRNLNDVMEVPEGKFATDETGMITSRFTGTGIEECESTYNKVLAKAIKFQGPPPEYIPNNHVYIVKTADGKYAKIRILSFFNEMAESGYISFKYVYQPDGSIWCAALWDVYRLSEDNTWERQVLEGNKDRITDITGKGDTLVVMTRSGIYESHAPYHAFKYWQLREPEGYTGKVSLFRTVWLLHSGELFGLPGKLIVDALALVLIFLCITGIIFTLAPKTIRRRKKKKKDTKRAVNTMKFSTKWHIKIGKWLFVPTLILAVTGMSLRPPMMIPFVMTSAKPLPGTTLDSDNPWHDKLRGIRWDDTCSEWLLSTSEGFFRSKDFKSVPERIEVAPPISPMGINVFERYEGNEWLIGSFSGIYRWDRVSGSIADYMNGEPYDSSKRSFYGSATANGYSGDIAGAGEIVFDYGKGAVARNSAEVHLPEMPETMASQGMSLWNSMSAGVIHLC